MKLVTLLATCLLLSPVFAEDTKPDLSALRPIDQRSIRGRLARAVEGSKRGPVVSGPRSSPRARQGRIFPPRLARRDWL